MTTRPYLTVADVLARTACRSRRMVALQACETFGFWNQR